MEEALPAGAQVYLPPLIEPNTSFQRVAVASLQDRSFYTDAPTFFPGALPASPSQVYGYGLLPAEAVPADWGFLPKALWSNDQAALYPRDPSNTQPSARLGASNATSEQFSESTLSGGCCSYPQRYRRSRRARDPRQRAPGRSPRRRYLRRVRLQRAALRLLGNAAECSIL